MIGYWPYSKEVTERTRKELYRNWYRSVSKPIYFNKLVFNDKDFGIVVIDHDKGGDPMPCGGKKGKKKGGRKGK